MLRGVPMAVIIGTRSPEVLHIQKIFITKQAAALSVGTTAMQLVGRDAIGCGLSAIDCGYGTPTRGLRSSVETARRRKAARA